MTSWQDPEWTEPDGRERGAGALVWLAVVFVIAFVLTLATVWIWM